MSVKKSFDVPRKAPARKAAAPAPRRKPTAKKPVKAPVRRSTLAARRREEKGRLMGFWVLGAVILVGAVMYGFWRPEVRITEVKAPHDAYVALAKESLSGTYWRIFPRDSIFFFPKADLRAAVMEEYPEISSVSISRTGFTSISLKTVSRSTAFWWCGTPENASAANTTCYEADAEGYIFRPVIAEEASTTPTGSTLRIYANLAETEQGPMYPLKAHMENLDNIPDVLRFVKAMKTLGVSPVSLAVREDEADLFVPSSGRGTRITYVLGREEAAASLAAAVFPSLNLTDGSVEYVDLRFSGKAYVKRRE